MIFLFAAVGFTITPYQQAWHLVAQVASPEGLGPISYTPFSFFTHSGVPDYYSDDAKIISLISPTRTSIAPGAHWSYCNGELRSGRMRRHCYTGDPVLTDLVCNTTSCGPLSFTATEHVGALAAADGRIILNGRPDVPPVLSALAMPSIRFEIIDQSATVWLAENKIDTTGSYIFCVVIIVALAHLTAGFPYVCRTCKLGCTDQAALLEHLNQHPNGAYCKCTHNFNAHSGLDHEFTPVITNPRSIIATNSGVTAALRLAAGLIAAAAAASVGHNETVLVAELNMRDALYPLAVVIILVVAIATVASIRGPGNKTWAHIAFLTCETLLLITLAYSIPKAYGEDVAAALLFVTGIGAALVLGRTVAELPLRSFLETFALLAILALIAMVMIFPALAAASGITETTQWPLSFHVAAAAAAIAYAQSG
jgi:hypothetical protein